MSNSRAERQPSSGALTGSEWLLWPLLALAVALAYAPAWHGGVLWDDDKHLTRAGLQSLSGLWRIWTDLRANEQYYPLLHSAFWLEHRLWGDATLGYHLINIVFHATTAFLFAVLLRRLKVPGAIVAAFLFALHPVQVESVAWMTEQKNVLSAVWYVSAAIAYLHFDDHRTRASYLIAVGLFVLALLSKTATVTLPGALLLLMWWRHGTLRWRRDVVPLLPFAAVAVLGGLVTMWVERVVVGAEGAEYHLSLLARTLIAGRAICFYAAKLFWPAHLTLIYPHWRVDVHDPLQYLYSLVVIGALVTAWMLRHKSRGPFAALAIFCITLAPVAGFLNIYWFRFSFVADHFQYFATMPLIALVSAGVSVLAQRWVAPLATATAMFVALVGPATALTWRQSYNYADVETLYDATIRENPEAWMAYNNLSHIYFQRAEFDKAIDYAQRAIRLNPRISDAHVNLGAALQRVGRLNEASAEYRTASELEPDLSKASNNSCGVFIQLGRLDDAIAACSAAIRVDPGYVSAYLNLSTALESAGRVDEAIDVLRRAVTIDPANGNGHYYLASALYRKKQYEEAASEFAETVRLKPDYAQAHAGMADALLRLGRAADAVAEYEKAIEYDPGVSKVQNNLGVALEALGRLREALTHYEEAVRLNPQSSEARANVAHVRSKNGS